MIFCQVECILQVRMVIKVYGHSIYTQHVYIVYELDTWPRNPTNIFPLKSCLFDTVKLVRNAIKSEFIDNGSGIAFGGEFSCSFDNDLGRNVVIFGIVNSLLSHTDKQKNNSLVLGEGPTDSINDSTDLAKKKFSINFSKANTKS